jgi:hypothetical protein
MNVARLTPYIIGLFTLVATAVAVPVYAQDGSTVDGEVQAASPCDLFPDGGDYLCIQSIVPIKAEIVARSGRRSYVLTSDTDGHITGKLPKGRYTLKVRSAVYGVRTFDGTELAVSPSTLRVRSGMRTSAGFSILHKSRTVDIARSQRSR